ncbi:zinc carboxypeptidase-like [Arctopsyche grandis]|uniref:zinc carboxypeptidase-like n=1 Tax=Arctopsyche grandis TaxID=121162 RepID=UPI00406D7648
MKLILLLFLGIVYVNGDYERASYVGYKVYRINPTTKEQTEILTRLLNNTKLDFWTNVIMKGRPVDIMVSPIDQIGFLEYMNSNKIDVEIFIEDLQELISNEVIGDLKATGKMEWNSYYTLEDIYDWMDSLPGIYPQVEVISAGKSYEDRDIKGVKISFKPDKKNVFIEGGIHAREWISPATATFLINEVLNSENPAFRRIAESFDWYIFPSVNPDGYAYSHSTTRYWRKTRSVNEKCHGVDANRNWDFYWGEFSTSTEFCSDTYGGTGPFSENETRRLANFIQSIVYRTVVYISFHSYSQYLLIPYAHSTEHLDNYDDLYYIGQKAIRSLAERNGTVYKLGTAAEILYKTSGTSADWVKSLFDVPIVYTYELRDTGEYGFMLPADQIIPNGLEVIDSMITIFEESEALEYLTID